MKLLLTWLAIVFVLSVYPFEDSGIYVYSPYDKVFHFVVYAITTLLLYRVLRDSRKGFWERWALTSALVIAAAYGLAMEIAQEVFGSRTFSLWDEAANIMGALSALIIIRAKSGGVEA
jgi:VanZ family protein